MHDSIGCKKLLYWITYLKTCARGDTFDVTEKNLLFLPLDVSHHSQDGNNLGATVNNSELSSSAKHS